MTTITLPPEIEQPLAEEAGRQGTTAELLALDSLRERFAPAEAVLEKGAPQAEVGNEPPAETLYESLKDFIGVLDSGEHVPGGAQMSTDTGRKFAEGMVKKRQEGHI